MSNIPKITTSPLKDNHYVDKWYEIANYLNNKIILEGEIAINQRDIWKRYLHEFTNEDWIYFCDLISLITDHNFRYTLQNNRDALIDALTKLQDPVLYSQQRWLNNMGATKQEIKNVLDIPNKGKSVSSTKSTAWKMLMSMREIWNKICGIDLPNNDSSKGKSI